MQGGPSGSWCPEASVYYVDAVWSKDFSTLVHKTRVRRIKDAPSCTKVESTIKCFKIIRVSMLLKRKSILILQSCDLREHWKGERFLLLAVSEGSAHGCLAPGHLGKTWQPEHMVEKLHFVADRKQQGRDWGINFKDMPLVTCFLQLGPT
jgi:hypothetical protein